MNISLKWLGRYVDLDDLDPRQVLNDLTLSTAEVEGLEVFGAGLEQVRVGHVVECGKHPDADKLSVTQVDLGDGALQQVICGAPNVAQGQRVVVISPGSRLPDGTKIKKAKIRGVESLGMICSERELGLSEEHEGILVLPEDAPIGKPLTEVLPIQDHVLEVDNKSINHRPDLWGHYGFARELAAIYGRPLRPLEMPAALPTDGAQIRVQIDDLAACPRYTGLVIHGAPDGKSPDWLRWLLMATGQRPISLLVDLTNFVMQELGQPMHAFDLRQIEGKTVGVRRARPDERITTLDGFERKLIDSDLLITADDAPVALAGIMGGEGTMVRADTEALFLESATFHAATVRRTSTRLGLRTDASARFEKTLDPALAETAALRFLSLLQQERPDARAAGPMSDPSGWTFPGVKVGLRRPRLDLKLGMVVPDAQVESILGSLEFGVTADADGWQVDVPSFRASKDIAIEDDLIEEVGRMVRYDNIPEQPLQAALEVPPRDPELDLERSLLLCGATELGASEAYNYSFVPDAVLEAVGAAGHEYSRVSNPVAPEITRMRRHVLPSLLSSLGPNLEFRSEAFLMECGKGYHPENRDEHGLPIEVRELSFAWARREGDSPYPELRSGVETLLARHGFHPTLEEVFVDGSQPWVHPGKSAALRLGESLVGFVAHLHPEAAHGLKLPGPVAIANLDLRKLLALGATELAYSPISPYPTQPVDIALLVPESRKAAEVARFLRACGKKLVQSVDLFEVYRGAGVPEGQKSLNFTVVLGSRDRTLSGKDEEKFIATVRNKAAEVEGELRG